jgi:hypothetical protein
LPIRLLGTVFYPILLLCMNSALTAILRDVWKSETLDKLIKTLFPLTQCSGSALNRYFWASRIRIRPVLQNIMSKNWKLEAVMRIILLFGHQ